MLLLEFIKMLLEHLLSNDYITPEQYDELEKIVCEDIEIEKRLKLLLDEYLTKKDKNLLIDALKKLEEQVTINNAGNLVTQYLAEIEAKDKLKQSNNLKCSI